MKPIMAAELALDGMMMAVWHRRPKRPVIIYSDRGGQFGCGGFTRWCQDNQLILRMSQRRNCYDIAVAEYFFSRLKKKRIKRRIYVSRQEAKSELLDYIEDFS